MFEWSQARRAPAGLLVAIGVLLMPWSWFVNLWFAENEHYKFLLESSHGFLFPTLQVGLPSLALLLLGCRAAGLRPADVGWRAHDLPAGLLATLILWSTVSLAGLLFSQSPPAWSTDWSTSWVMTSGRLVGQLFGNALLEETLYRGLFLVQFLLLLRARGAGPNRTAWLAAAAASIVFSIPHVPNRLLKHEYGSLAAVLTDQGQLLFAGMVFAWHYLRTRNLWWAVGAHSLSNYPTLATDWNIELTSPNEITFFLAIGFTAAWPWLRKLVQRKE